MFGVLKSIILINITFSFVKCLIPTLSVQKIDKKIISRQRKDTLDMCRIFNTENDKLQANAIDPPMRGYTPYQNHRRSKRDTHVMKLGNPPISAESAKRIENIVDKLYDDMDDTGKKVSYMTRMTTVQEPVNKTLRRFNFAPAKLLGPGPDQKRLKKYDKHNPSFHPWPKRWPHGIVPYFVDPKTYDDQLVYMILDAFDYFASATCIRLQRLHERPTDQESLQKVEWLYITNPTGIRQCVHSNERKPNKGVQMVVFGYDCLSLGEIVHEVMHILGFSHEHTRPDRDQFITVLWNNIKPGYKKYFETRPKDQLLSIPYDYSSVLHYPPRAFSKNGQVTIMAQDGVKLGQREGLSETDVEKVALVFGTECIERNKQYLLITCPSAIKAEKRPVNVTKSDIDNYFNGRLWPYGIVNYKLKDKLEFTFEERETIQNVIEHIEKETCIRFKNLAKDDDPPDADGSKPHEALTLGEASPDHKKAADPEAIGGPEDRHDHEQPKETHHDYGQNTEKQDVTETTATENFADNEIKSNDEKNENQNMENSGDEAEKRRSGNKLKKIKVSRRHLPKPENRNATPSRRHAQDILVFTRSSEPGCNCPPPGKPNGIKVLKINGDCFNFQNDLLHLMVHVLGLDHQHNMHDRDSYLHIAWNKLTPEVNNEMRNKLPPAASVGFDYDYKSVMHYPWLQIKNGVTNIMYPIWNDGWVMGDWQGLSSIDVQKINGLYLQQCTERQKQI